MAGYNDQALYDAVQSGKLKLSDLTTQGQNNYNAYAATKQLTKAQPSVLTAPVEQQPSATPQKKAKKQVQTDAKAPSSEKPLAATTQGQQVLKQQSQGQDLRGNYVPIPLPMSQDVANVMNATRGAAAVAPPVSYEDNRSASQKISDWWESQKQGASALKKELAAGHASQLLPQLEKGLVDTATLGLTKYAPWLQNESQKLDQQASTSQGSQFARELGSFGGYTVPFEGALKGLQAVGKIPAVASAISKIPGAGTALGKIAGRIGEQALAGGLVNLGEQTTDKILGGKAYDPNELASSALMGGAFGTLGEGLGLAGKGINAGINAGTRDLANLYAQKVQDYLQQFPSKTKAVINPRTTRPSGFSMLPEDRQKLYEDLTAQIEPYLPTQRAARQPALEDAFNTEDLTPNLKRNQFNVVNGQIVPKKFSISSTKKPTETKTSKKYSIKNAQDARQKMYEGMFDSLDYPDRQKVLENVFGGDLTNVVRRTSPEVEALAGQTSEQQRTQQALEEAFKNLPSFQQNAAIREVLNQKPSIGYRGAELPNTPVRPVEQPKPAVETTPPSGISLTREQKQKLYEDLSAEAETNPEVKRILTQLELENVFKDVKEPTAPTGENKPGLTEQLASDLGAKTEPVVATEAKKKGGRKPKNVATQIENDLKGTTQQIGEDLSPKSEEQVAPKSEEPAVVKSENRSTKDIQNDITNLQKQRNTDRAEAAADRGNKKAIKKIQESTQKIVELLIERSEAYLKENKNITDNQLKNKVLEAEQDFEENFKQSKLLNLMQNLAPNQVKQLERLLEDFRNKSPLHKELENRQKQKESSEVKPTTVAKKIEESKPLDVKNASVQESKSNVIDEVATGGKKKQTIYHTVSTQKDGTYVYKAVEGKVVDVADGIDAFAHKNDQGLYVISETTTGAKVSPDAYKTIEEVIQATKDRFDKLGMDKVVETIQKHIKKVSERGEELAPKPYVRDNIKGTKEPLGERKKPKPPVAETKSADEQVRESRTGSQQQQQQTSAQSEKPVTREEVMNTLRNKLGVTIRTKRLGRVKKTVLGINKTKSEVSRTRTHGDISTIAHEVGHTLDTRYDLTSKANQKELIDFVNRYNPSHLSAYPNTADHVPEAIAEYFRAYLTDRATAESMAPEFTALLEKTLSKKDFAGLLKSAEVSGKWHNQTNAVDRVKEHILSGKAPKQKSWTSWVERRYQETVDRFLPLAKAGIQALNPKLRGKSNLDAFMSHAKGLHPESMAAYEQARRYAGTPAITRLFLDENLEPVMKELSKHKLSLDDLIAYATAKHASDLHDIAKSKGILDSPDGFNQLTGMKDADVQGTISALGTPEMQRVHKMLLNYNRNLLDIAYEGGLISEKTRDTLVNRYPNYVPFQRFFSESEGEANFTGKGTQKAFADIYSPIKSFKGSTRTIKDPLESMVANAHSIIDAVERNKVGQAVAKLYNNQGAGFLVERLGVKARQGIAKGVPKENIITVMENGKRVLYQVNPDLYQVLQNINPKSAEFVEKYASKVANVMRGAISFTPKFVIKQLLVDDWNTLMVSDKRFFIPYVDTIRGMVHLFKSPDVVKRWIKSGGAYGAMFSQDPRYIQAAINEIRTDQSMLPKLVKYVRITPKVLRHLLETPNEARSLITFKQLTEGKGYGGKKYTDEQAAYIARDLMDFQRRGSKMDAISRSTPFFGANIQAKDRSVRASRQNWKQFMAKGAVSMALPSVAIYYYNRYYASDKQKQAIEEAPTWFKNTNYLVAVPGTDLVARFPKPYDVSWAFANGMEEVIRRIEKDNPKAISDFAEENLINDALPQLFSPALIAIGAMANYDFHTGTPIVSKSLENPNKSEEYDAYTSKFARVLGDTFKVLNLSPKKIDYVMKGYLGDYATIGNKVLDSTFLKNVYKDDVSVPDDGFWKNYLGVNNFIYPEGKYQAQSVTDFYDNYQKIAGDYDVAKRKGKNYGMSNLYGTVNQAYKYMNNDQRMIKAIQSDKAMSVDDKKVAIDNLKQDMLKIARSTNNTIKSVGGGQ